MLGRGVVMTAGDAVPDAWTDAPEVWVSDSVIGDPDLVESLVDRLHRAWVRREPTVVVWDGPPDLLEADESTADPPWRLDAGHLFPLERLRFLCFSNNYDARTGPPKWWWSVKARRIGASPGGPADVVLADGTTAWVDGGPRQPHARLSHRVIHGESIEAGRETPVPPVTAAAAPDLASDQRQAVDHVAGPARIIAPAGSGKTRTLTARLRHLLSARAVEPELVTALAYNERAAAELRDRLGVGRELARTIHSMGWEILREARPGLELLDERGMRETIDRLVSIPRRANADPVAPYLEALSEVRSRLRDPAEVELSRDDVPGFGSAFEAYRERLYAMGRVDHGEQVYGAIEALTRDPTLRRRWQRRCRHLLVDEFQDLTPAYLLLIRLVASPELSVFGVGDDDQVIYGYDGADPGFLIDFDRFFPGAGLHALVTNYRSPAPIVVAARHLLSHNRRRIDKTIDAADDAATAGDTLLVEEHPGGRLAARCAELVAGWIDAGVDPGEIAVLTRVNSSLIAVKAALAELDIPTHDLLGPGSLDRTAIAALFAWMRLALDPDAMRRADLLAAIRRPGRGLTRIARELLTSRTRSPTELAELGERLDAKQAERWAGFCADLTRTASVAARGSSAELTEAIVNGVGLGVSARALDSGRGNAARSGHLDDLVAVERAAALHADAADFEPWLRRLVAAPSDGSGVTLSSVHRVKGMEWKRVIIFGCDAGAMPHDLADDAEEERRVFHVALTRAIDGAVVLADERRPSPFIAELAVLASPDRPEPTRARSVAARSKQLVVAGDRVRLWGGHQGVVERASNGDLVVELDGGGRLTAKGSDVIEVTRDPAIEAGPASQRLVAGLKEWRSDAARRLGVPAFVVLHDKTIDEIARRMPRSESELLTVSGIGPAKLDQHGDDILAVVDRLG